MKIDTILTTVRIPLSHWERGQGRGCEAQREVFFDHPSCLPRTTLDQSRFSLQALTPNLSQRERAKTLQSNNPGRAFAPQISVERVSCVDYQPGQLNHSPIIGLAMVRYDDHTV